MLLTNQVPRLVSSHIETRRFLSHALRNKLRNCDEREMAEVARPYEWNDRKVTIKLLDHVHYTDPCAKFNIRDIKCTRKLIPVAKFNIRDL